MPHPPCDTRDQLRHISIASVSRNSYKQYRRRPPHRRSNISSAPPCLRVSVVSLSSSSFTHPSPPRSHRTAFPPADTSAQNSSPQIPPRWPSPADCNQSPSASTPSPLRKPVPEVFDSSSTSFSWAFRNCKGAMTIFCSGCSSFFITPLTSKVTMRER